MNYEEYAMKLPNSFLLLLLSLLLIKCSQPKCEDYRKLNYEAIAGLIVQRSDLEKDQKVLLVGVPGNFDALVDELARQIEESEAEYLGCLSTTSEQPEAWRTDFVDSALELSKDELQDFLKKMDLGIMLPGSSSGDEIYDLIQQNLNAGMGRTIHFHWSGAYDLNGSPLVITPEIDAFYDSVLLNTDYDQLESLQRQFEDSLRKSKIQVTTPAGTNISFEIGDRPVTKQNGNASKKIIEQAKNLIDREIELPAGAIRVAPIETSVQGVIVFPDSKWSGVMVEGLRLTFENGIVVKMEAQKGIEAVEKVMERVGVSAKSFREFALGFNDQLAIPDNDPWIPYYGYGAGVVRLSLGDNSELGGDVGGGFVRWNFFVDATVKVGEDIWVENGKMIFKN